MTGQLRIGDDPDAPPARATHRERFLAALLAEWARPGVTFEKRPAPERARAEEAARAALDTLARPR